MTRLPVPLILEGKHLFLMMLLTPTDFSFPVCPSSISPLLIPLPPDPPGEVLLRFNREFNQVAFLYEELPATS